MALLNYTTQITVEKTIGEIQAMLAKAGASAILTEYDGAHNVTAISFKIQTQWGVMPYRLPCNPQAVSLIMNKQVREREIPRKFYNDMDQARRVGWRILKDWLEAQLAIVATEMVKLEQVFLPYAQTNTGETLYERMVETRFNGMLLEHKPEVSA